MLTQVLLLLALGDSPEPPTSFRILKAGANVTNKGTVVFDAEAAKLVAAAHAEHGADLFVDYEHKSILKQGAPVDGGKAAAWFKPVVRNGELWAEDVSWTDAAKAALKAREYRYFSPAVLHDSRGRVHKLVNVALTNLPATKQIRALVADETPSQHKGNPTMDPTETELALFTALGDPKLSLAAALGSIQALKEEAAKVKTLSDELATLKLEVTGTKVDKLLAAAKDAGKVSEAELPKLREQGIKDLAWLEGYLPLKTASAITKEHKEPPAKEEGGTGDGKLTATELKVIRLYGCTPDEFIKQKQRLALLDAAERGEEEEVA
jgi:phage I-like protein